ncbi:MAG: hypothetical protein UW53_C0010G0042 [Candidatus Giovannonibacteria bacterium GW2011_GWA1_44_25]|uniref:Uncharacterized protein n=1 Tax=Candidatus Giovannonibacteria bacterium GW2011_GWA1_44_25 TaxID=1618645 RepID=A0A0G1KTH5_9BACT|nr:MAG: hypothetical protein UW53_C0010G0042 [Candidatus Giovannonibacteria bacterium GW2011_GWA1_44_25]
MTEVLTVLKDCNCAHIEGYLNNNAAKNSIRPRENEPEGGVGGRNSGMFCEPTSRAASQSAGGGYCGKQHKRGMGA